MDSTGRPILAAPPTKLIAAAELALFAGIFLIAWYQAHQASERARTTVLLDPSGGQLRPLFLRVLSLALLLRFVFIVVSITVRDPKGVGLSLWLRVLIRSIPSLVFLTAYSITLLFWLEIYYRSQFRDIPMLRLTFVYSAGVIFLIFFVVAFITYMQKAYTEFRDYATFFIGLCYVLVAIAWYFCGRLLIRQLQLRVHSMALQYSGRGNFVGPRTDLSGKLRILCSVCPFFFFGNGVYSLLSSTYIIHRYPPFISRFNWDFFVYFLTDGVPSAVIIAVSWQRTRSPIRLPEGSANDARERSLLGTPAGEYHDEDHYHCDDVSKRFTPVLPPAAEADQQELFLQQRQQHQYLQAPSPPNPHLHALKPHRPLQRGTSNDVYPLEDPYSLQHSITPSLSERKDEALLPRMAV